MHKVNHIETQKEKNESHFRVHFYIRNVYYSSEKRLSNFLEESSNRISQIVPISIIQIYGAIKKFVDISVGIKNDNLATFFLESNKKIYLPGQNKTMIAHQVCFSQTFLAFYDSNKKEPLELSKKLSSSQEILKAESKGTEHLPSLQLHPKQYQSQSKKSRNQDSGSKKQDLQVFRHYFLYVLCVPLEYKQKDVAHVLNYYKIKVRVADWKIREDVQYLYIELYEGLTQAEIQSLDLYIDKYPLLISSKLKNQTVIDIIMRHEIELNCEKDIDEVELMKFSFHIGGVVSLIKDEFYGPRKYVIAYSTIHSLNQFIDEVHSHFKQCRTNKPKYAVRLSRLEKSFNFVHMIDHLASYERELEKAQQAGSSSYNYS